MTSRIQPNEDPVTRTLFVNARVFDGLSPELGAPCYVAVNGGVIESVTGGRPAGSFSQEVDLADRCLMPGLIDAHFHAYATEVDTAKCDAFPATYQSQRARLNLEALYHCARRRRR